MVKIFISYRREDTKKDAGRIYDRLTAEFGTENVFKDVYAIPIGKDFRDVFEEWVNRCDIMLVLIGSHWLIDAHGNSRINSPDDFVREEVRQGLVHGRVKVIPVIIEPASHPASSQLPEALRELAYLNAAFVRDDPDFPRDVDRLIASIKAIVQNNGRTQKSWWDKLSEGQGSVIASFVGAVAVIIAAMIGLFGIVLPILDDTPTPIVTETVIVTSLETPSDTPPSEITPPTHTSVSSSVPAVTSTPTPIYEEDFNDNEAQGWVLGTNWGTFRMNDNVNGMLNRATDSFVRYTEARYIPSQDWDNVVIEFRFYVSSAINIHFCHEQNYMIKIDVAEGNFSLKNENSEHIRAIGNLFLSEYSWINVRLEWGDRNIVATINSVTISGLLACYSNEFGFGTDSPASVDDIRVWSMDN